LLAAHHMARGPMSSRKAKISGDRRRAS